VLEDKADGLSSLAHDGFEDPTVALEEQFDFTVGGKALRRALVTKSSDRVGFRAKPAERFEKPSYQLKHYFHPLVSSYESSSGKRSADFDGPISGVATIIFIYRSIVDGLSPKQQHFAFRKYLIVKDLSEVASMKLSNSDRWRKGFPQCTAAYLEQFQQARVLNATMTIKKITLINSLETRV
jgi:hypothetical protein